jgi:hypothetical protein
MPLIERLDLRCGHVEEHHVLRLLLALRVREVGQQSEVKARILVCEKSDLKIGR